MAQVSKRMKFLLLDNPWISIKIHDCGTLQNWAQDPCIHVPALHSGFVILMELGHGHKCFPRCICMPITHSNSISQIPHNILIASTFLMNNYSITCEFLGRHVLLIELDHDIFLEILQPFFKIVKMDVKCPICIHHHFSVHLNTSISSIKMDIDHLFKWLKTFG